MSIVRQTIAWTMLFMWGLAYLAPGVLMLMFVVWLWDGGPLRTKIGPFMVGAAVVWMAYIAAESGTF